MKNVLVLLLISSLLSCSQKEISMKQLVERNGKIHEVNKDNPYTGKVFVKYENQQYSLQGDFNNGLKDGMWMEYYENGQVKKEEHFSNNIKDGVQKAFAKNAIKNQSCPK